MRRNYAVFHLFQDYRRIAKMGHVSLITMAVVVIGATAYIPPEKVSSRKIRKHIHG
jgi:hypothetical protein